MDSKEIYLFLFLVLKIIFGQTPTKAATCSLKIMQSSLNIIKSTKKCVIWLCYCMRKGKKLTVLAVNSFSFQNSLGTLGTNPSTAGQKLKLFN